MKPIIPGLQPGAEGPEVANLQDALHALLVRALILSDDPDERRERLEQLSEERLNSLYSDFTHQIVSIFQEERGLDPHGDVDEATAVALNDLLRDIGLLDGAAAPLRLQLSGAPLSFGIQNDDVVRVHRVLHVLGRSVPVSETTSRVLGAGTVATIKALQAELNLPATGVVDRATVEAINVKLDGLTTEQRVVRGRVRDANGNSFSNGFIQIFSRSANGEQVLAKEPLQDGNYQIPYQPPPGSHGRVDLRIAVLDADGGIVETTPSGASILPNAGPIEIVNFVLSGEANPPLSEFELVLNGLKPLLDGHNVADLMEDEDHREISLLAIRSGYPAELVARQVIAAKLEKETQTPAPVFYGLLRQDIPTSLTALHGTDLNLRLRALHASIEQGIVPEAIDGRKLEELLCDLTPVAVDELQPLLGNILGEDELKQFATHFHENSQDPAAFWEKIAADPALAERAAELKLTVQVGNLLNNHTSLVAAVREMPNIKQASDLARLSGRDWKFLIETEGISVPEEAPGGNLQEKTDNYVKQIVRQVEGAFSTEFLTKRLDEATPGGSRVVSFLETHSGYNLKTYPSQFFKENPAAAQELGKQGIDELASLQRVHRLASSATATSPKTSIAEETIALTGKGFRSAAQIAAMDPGVFVRQNQDIFSEERARELHEQARRRNAITLALLGEYVAPLNQTGLQALPRLNTLKQQSEAQSSIPDWETLFGGFDFCACSECSSAHGPAAYFVDILQFLSERRVDESSDQRVGEVLFTRRPDLGDVELSCENTNIVLPYVDLVNEILENAIAPPPPFAPFALPGEREVDLTQSVASAELAAAFNPHLVPGAQIETLVAGERWRVQDEPFAYSVVKENGTLEVVARSRQTSGEAGERRAIPQYRNQAAYKELRQAVYPLNLPFDLPFEEAQAFLGHLGVARRDLIEALRLQPGPFDPSASVAARLAAEGLGLTHVERKIVVAEPLTPSQKPSEFWGSVSLETLKPVQRLLDRFDLSYEQLDTLLATWFVNPDKTLAISAGPDARVATCDTNELEIEDLTEAVLGRMHRFLRLWRKLGWTIMELDKVIRAFVPAPQSPEITNEILIKLDHLRQLSTRLRLPVVRTLAFWKPIDTAAPDSLYASLFQDPAVFNPPLEAFRLNAEGTELVHKDQKLQEHAATLLAIFRLTPEAFALLVERTTGLLTLNNLSFLYRHTLLARQLGLPVQELLVALELTEIEPFRANQTQETLHFVEVVQAIRDAGFSFSELDYLIRHRANPAAPFVPLESDLTETLKHVCADLQKAGGETEAEKRKLQESAVIDRVAAALALPADVTSALLERVQHGNNSALEHFLALAAIPEEQELSRENTTFQPAFEILDKLLKIAIILQTLKLPATLLDWLFEENPWLTTAHDQDNTAVAFAEWFSLIQFQQLRKELALEEAALVAILLASRAGAIASDRPAQLATRNELIRVLSSWLGWPHADLETLLGEADNEFDEGLLNASMPVGYRGLGLLIRLQQAMALLKRLGVGAAQANKWCEDLLAPEDAQAIRSAAKAHHGAESWLAGVTGLQVVLRDRQREALASYLLARPEIWVAEPEQAAEEADAADLYARFLIDVEMSSCLLTSRLKQAIGSVQLFAQRCLLGLEDGIKTSESKWLEWEWMKNFRAWEANRKIWLYPENWLEPELRGGKTPFFKDLENELLQTDVDEAAAEQALLHYLEKLDEVAQLQIVGVYEDDENNTLYVFGRTFNVPHIYYYRRREGTTQSWTPWEKLDLDIEGDHLIPVAWNRRLMLIWPIFTEKAEEKEVVMLVPGGSLAQAERYWEIQLAWSEYQHGRWSGKNLSQAVQFVAYHGENDILFGIPSDPPKKAQSQNTQFIAMIDQGGVDSDDDSGGTGTGGGGATGGSTSVPPRSNNETNPRKLVSPEMMVFKAFAFDELLVVRGYLRRDYRAEAESSDVQIACVFGEFHFQGCRKIIATRHVRQITRKNFALAPTGTKFDHMWFTQTGSSLVLFDGQFPVFPTGPLTSEIVISPNKPVNIADNPSDTLENKLDITVLDRTPTPFRLLAPHQDLQFVADRPFFFMDGKRAFMITSTGSTTRRSDLAGWVEGNVATAWRVGFFPQTGPTPPDGNGAVAEVERVAAALTVLVPGPGGRRITRQMAAVNLQPEFRPRTLIPTFSTTREYRFVNFHHPYLCDFEKTLNRQGITGLLSLDSQSLGNANSFDVYMPQARVLNEHPRDEVEFQSAGAYEIYNWELFFHIPLLIASRLQANQRFQEAQRWFHFIFDPTGASGGDIPQRYWRTKPFHERLKPEYEAESVRAIEEMIASGISEELKVAVAQWRANPFSPHTVARLRSTAYQKNVVMKYIDNLIAWGDQLFRRETLESINEATQLYVLAAEILGRRPELIERDQKPAIRTFNTLNLEPGGLGNSLEQLELAVTDAGSTGATPDPSQTPDPVLNSMLYFCIPENDRLLGYWNTVADRLFKIRHCMNIEGQVRQLPLFEPPIDPALLVRAQAAGLSIADVLSDINVPLPNYRFSVMLQKANELVAEVRNLGATLLSALEKRDVEALSLLRSGQELRLLEAIRDIRVKQIDEATANVAALEKSREMAQARKDYYESREFFNLWEGSSLLLTSGTLLHLGVKTGAEAISIPLSLLPDVKAGSPTTIGITIGGSQRSASTEAHRSLLQTLADISSVGAAVANTMGTYSRRSDDWRHQADLATIELKQLDQQLVAAEIRIAVAEQELHNHDRQIENAREVDDFLKGKFSNQDLYQFMIGRVSGLYFQSYQLAYDLSKRTEQCFRFELGVSESNFIQFGYWESLKKGLLAGETLQYDLRRLETAYLEQNRREYELTKHISLALLDPLALVKLRETGKCFFTLPEEIFDLDFPGHYFRRIKSVSVTLPCVAGPYTTISCTLRLEKNSIRINTTVGASGYAHNADNGHPIPDERFIENRIPVNAIAASSGQNDSGVFELGFRDERYLPFEGAGVISNWWLELFNDVEGNFGKPLRQFDYGTITDAVLHVKYTAREDAGEFKNKAVAHLRNYFSQEGTTPSLRMFDLRREFPTQWHRFLHPTNPANGNVFELEMTPNLFPYRDQGKTLKINQLSLLARCTEKGNYRIVLNPPLPAGSDEFILAPEEQFGDLHSDQRDVAVELVPTDPPVKWQLKMTRPDGENLQEDPVKGSMEVADVLVVLGYEWEEG